MIIETVQSTHPYYRISDPVYSYTFGYFTFNSWLDDDRVLLKRMRRKDDTFESVDLVIVDLKAQTETVLPVADPSDPAAKPGTAMVHGHTAYVMFAESVVAYDLLTGESREVLRQKGCNMPSVTNDGRYLTMEVHEENRDVCVWVDLHTGETRRIDMPSFPKPFSMADHMMICPTDPEVIFFAHEGTTQYISNRLWLIEPGKAPRNIAPQRLGENGELIDCFGHESWAGDGKGLYFVKFDVSPKPPRGIGYVDRRTGKAEILYTAYSYWHVCCSPSSRYLAADTVDQADLSSSGVCLIDRQTGKETELVRVGFSRHPAHPHPSFSPSEQRLIFHDELPDGRCCVGFTSLDAFK